MILHSLHGAQQCARHCALCLDVPASSGLLLLPSGPTAAVPGPVRIRAPAGTRWAAGKPERIRTEIRRFVSLENRFGGIPQASVFKLVFNARSGRVLGAHLMDNAAPEIVQTFAVALRLGVKMSHLKTTARYARYLASSLTTVAFGPGSN